MTKLVDDKEGSCPSLEFFQTSDIMLRFETRAAQSRAVLKTMPNLALFDPPFVKIRGGVGEISELRFKALPRTEPPGV